MASTSGQPLSPVIAELVRAPQKFSFFQAVQLLSAYARARHGQDTEDFLERSLRVRADLSLAFPASDLVGCEVLPPDGPVAGAPETFQLVTTFLGLYGTGSPLPTYYTEDLFEEAGEDGSVVRDFLDIVGNPFFSLLYRGWTKYRLMLKVEVERDDVYLEELYSFLGLGHPLLREGLSVHRKALRYMGLVSQHPRSASGLESIVADFACVPSGEVEQCVRREVEIPRDQRTFLARLNHRLGENAVLGSTVADRSGKIVIRLCRLDAARFHALHPLTRLYEELRQLVRLYLTDPLEYELHAVLKQDEVRTTCPGNRDWACLGWNTWLFSGHASRQAVATIPMWHLGPDGPLAPEARGLVFHSACTCAEWQNPADSM